jgi:hypothetical protein
MVKESFGRAASGCRVSGSPIWGTVLCVCASLPLERPQLTSSFKLSLGELLHYYYQHENSFCFWSRRMMPVLVINGDHYPHAQGVPKVDVFGVSFVDSPVVSCRALGRLDHRLPRTTQKSMADSKVPYGCVSRHATWITWGHYCEKFWHIGLT